MSGQISDYKNLYLSGSLKKDIALFKDIFKKSEVSYWKPPSMLIT